MSDYFAAEVEFHIAAVDVASAVVAVRDAARRNEQDWDEAVRELPDDMDALSALTRICRLCGWKPEVDLAGEIIGLHMPNGRSPDHVAGRYTAPLFAALAPYVRDGSYVQVTSDDGMDIVYHFRSGTVMSATTTGPLPAPNERRALVSLSLLQRIRTYLLATDAAAGGMGSALAAELARELTQQ